jgi:hypothetical protein
MSEHDGWRKARRAVTAANAFNDATRSDGDNINCTGGIQDPPRGSHPQPDPIPPPRKRGSPHARESQYPQKFTGPSAQGPQRAQPSQPYTPQHQSGPFGPLQRMYTSPAAATDFAQPMNLVPTFDPLNRNQVPSAPLRPVDTTGDPSYGMPQRTVPPMLGAWPQDPTSFSSDPRYASQGMQPAANERYYDQGSYPPQSCQEPQHQAQYGQPPGLWDQNTGPSTYQSNATGTCTQCSNFLAQ